MKTKFVGGDIIEHRFTREQMMVIEPIIRDDGCCSLHPKLKFLRKYRLRTKDYDEKILREEEFFDNVIKHV